MFGGPKIYKYSLVMRLKQLNNCGSFLRKKYQNFNFGHLEIVNFERPQNFILIIIFDKTFQMKIKFIIVKK